MVLAPLAPAAMLRLVGLAASVKLGGAATVSETVALAVIAPEVPVTVTATVPKAAVAAAESVSVVDLVDEGGLNVLVTPAGRPLMEKLTVPVKPDSGVIAMVLAPLAPRWRLMAAGVAAMVKLPLLAAPTVRLIGVLECKLPDVPVIVIVALPKVAALLAVKVSRLDPVPGLKDAEIPLGSPEALRETLPLKSP